MTFRSKVRGLSADSDSRKKRECAGIRDLLETVTGQHAAPPSLAGVLRRLLFLHLGSLGKAGPAGATAGLRDVKERLPHQKCRPPGTLQQKERLPPGCRAPTPQPRQRSRLGRCWPPRQLRDRMGALECSRLPEHHAPALTVMSWPG